VRVERYVEEVNYDICWIEHIEKEPICFLHSARGYVGKKSDLIELWNRRQQYIKTEDKKHALSKKVV
jgi:hypothetical protein